MFKTIDFIRQKPAVIKYFKKKGVSEETISEYCVMSGVPIVVVCAFIKEEMPEHSKLCEDKIKSLNDFFGTKAEKVCDFCVRSCGNDYCSTKEKK